MRFGLRGVLLVSAGCWALACGGRDAGDLVDYNGTFPVSGGSGGQAAGGNNGKVGGAGTIGGTGTSGGAPSVGGGGSTGVGGRPVGIGGAIATGGAPTFPMPQDRCSNFCGLLNKCGQDSPECSSNCSAYLSQVPQDTACYNSRLLALDCYQSILQFGCRAEDAQAKCGDILAEADRCAQPPPPPPPPGTCESYCQLNLQCSGAPLDNRYSDCVNTCYSEIYSYSPQCQGYIQAGKDCRSAVLSERCDFNDTQNRCSYWDSNASSCQFGNPIPNPIPVPPQGCFGSVSVNAPGYCDSQLSCSGTKFELQCQPSSFGMTSTCTCTQYYQGAGAGGFAGTGGVSGGSVGGVSGFNFDVNFGDCQTALNYCSGTPTAVPPSGFR